MTSFQFSSIKNKHNVSGRLNINKAVQKRLVQFFLRWRRAHILTRALIVIVQRQTIATDKGYIRHFIVVDHIIVEYIILEHIDVDHIIVDRSPCFHLPDKLLAC